MHKMIILNKRDIGRIGGVLLLLFFLFGYHVALFAQTDTYKQLGNELQFTRVINDKWTSELYLGGCFSNTPEEDRVLKTNIQRYAMGWAHYYYSPRWKLSSFLAYFYNQDIPEIGQFESPEWRLALQGIYFFHKIGYTFSTRMRAEFRFIRNEEGVYEDVYRYRQQVKYLKPINSQFLRKGVVYMLAEEEISFKSNAKVTGLTYFDRNRFSVGAGYLFTDDLQVELAYINEFLPRDENSQLYHALAFTITFNNLLTHLRKKISTLSTKPVEGD
jgi:hypothetical protein